MIQTAYDYVIVGAGSAGCVLADRLTEDRRSTVLALEYGGSDRALIIQMPAALSMPMKSRTYNWGYRTEPEAHLGGRRINCPRGKVLGGSSSINGLVYVRGHPLDFDRWEEEGAEGWSYAERASLLSPRRELSRAAAMRGGDTTGRSRRRAGCNASPLYEAFIEAGRQAGYAVSADLNGGRQEGFGWFDMTVKDGVRWSAANAYLRPAMKRPNLTVLTHALAERIAFKGRRAIGVHYRHGGRDLSGERETREVILSGGAINSPQLLKLSGVGPAAELRALGIEVVRRPAGRRREPAGPSRVLFPGGLEAADHALRPHRPGRAGPRRLALADCAGRGLGATNHFEAGGFIRSRAGVALSRHPVPFPADGGRLRRLVARQRARLPGPCRTDAVEEPRLGTAQVRRSAPSRRTSISTT